MTKKDIALAVALFCGVSAFNEASAKTIDDLTPDEKKAFGTCMEKKISSPEVQEKVQALGGQDILGKGELSSLLKRIALSAYIANEMCAEDFKIEPPPVGIKIIQEDTNPPGLEV